MSAFVFKNKGLCSIFSGLIVEMQKLHLQHVDENAFSKTPPPPDLEGEAYTNFLGGKHKIA